MLELIHQAGWGAYPILLTFVAGMAAVFTLGRARRRPGAIAAAFAVAVLGMAALGTATGQRKVASAVDELPEDDPRRLEYLNIGTMEASTCLLLGGAAAVILMATGGVLVLRQRPEE